MAMNRDGTPVTLTHGIAICLLVGVFATCLAGAAFRLADSLTHPPYWGVMGWHGSRFFNLPFMSAVAWLTIAKSSAHVEFTHRRLTTWAAGSVIAASACIRAASIYGVLNPPPGL